MRRTLDLIKFSYLKVKKIFKFSPHDITTIQGKSNERYRRVLLTGGSTAIVKICSALINLITVPLTVKYLGAERYGLWMAISSVVALMSFADLGLGNGLLNAVSKAHGRKSNLDAQIAVSSTLFILTCISLLLLIIFISVYPFISWEKVFNVKSPLAIKESGPTALVLVVIFIINIPLGITRRIQEGYQEGYKFQLWQILGSLASFAGLLLCIFLKSGLVWLVLAFSGGQLIATILNGINLFSRKRQYLRPRINYIDLKIGKRLIKAGLVFFMLGLFTLFANASDDIIIAQTLGVSAVSGYEIVKKLFFFTMITSFLIQPLWPAFGEAMESGDIAWIRNALKKGVFLSISIAAIIALPLLLFGKQIISIWVGKEFSPSWVLLIGFYIYIVLNNYIGLMSAFLNSGDLVKKQLIPILLTAMTGILLKIFLSIHFGVSGIIWATIISWSAFYIIPSYYLSKSILQLKK